MAKKYKKNEQWDEQSPSLLCYTSMMQKEKITSIIEEYMKETDCFLVNVSVTPDNRVSVEIDSTEGVSIDFCAKLNRHIEQQFDREVEDFELEVGSAGITSPFRILAQYKKNIGNEVEVLTKTGVKLVGTLTQVTEEHFTIEVEKMVKPEGAKRKMAVIEPLTFNYNEVKQTKYHINFK